MQTEFAFFPGCVLTQAAKESKMALEAVAPRLGIKLKEIPGWSCCGASQAQDVDPVATLVANARNLALAENLGLPVLTSCSTCLLMLRRAKAELDNGKKDRINTFLAKGNMAYKGTSDVTSLLWVLAQNAQVLKRDVFDPGDLEESEDGFLLHAHLLQNGQRARSTGSKRLHVADCGLPRRIVKV